MQIREGKGLLSSACYDLVGHEPVRIILRPLCKCLCKPDSITMYDLLQRIGQVQFNLTSSRLIHNAIVVEASLEQELPTPWAIVVVKAGL